MSESPTEQYLLKQYRLTRIFSIITIVLVSLSSVISIILLTISLSRADKPSASFVIGQYDSQDKADFTRANRNNVATPNAAGVNNPKSVVEDPIRHRLYVADSINNRVLVFNLNTQNELIDTTADFVLGQTNFSSNCAPNGSAGSPSCAPNGATTASSLYRPSALAITPTNGRLFVMDTGRSDVTDFSRRILVFNTTELSSGMAASNVIGQPDFVTMESGRPWDQNLDESTTLLADDTHQILYVGKGNIYRGVYFYDLSNISNDMLPYSGVGDNFMGDSESNIYYANGGLALDSVNDRLYVADSGKNRVLVLDAADTREKDPIRTIDVIGVLGQTNYTNEGHSTAPYIISASEFKPVSLTIDPQTQKLFVGDDESWCIRVDDQNPQNCAQGNNAGRTLVFDVAQISNGEAAVNVLGAPDLTTAQTEWSRTSANRYGALFLSTGQKLYATDTSLNRILIYDVATITNNEEAAGIIGQTTGDGRPQWTSTRADNPSTNAKGMDLPTGQIVDPIRHRMIIADAANNRVLIRNLDQNNRPVSSSADVVIGQPNMYEKNQAQDLGVALQRPPGPDDDLSGWFGQNKLAGLSFPPAVFSSGDTGLPGFAESAIAGLLSSSNPLAYDPVRNRLFVADMLGGCIMVYDLSNPTNGMNASYVIGKPNFNSTPSTFDAIQAYLSGGSYNGLNERNMILPMGVTVDPVGNRLFVVDPIANRVTVYNLNNIANGMPATTVLGQSDFTTVGQTLLGLITGAAPNVPQPSASNFLIPNSITFDPVQNRLFVGDIGFARVLQFDAANLSNNKPASHVLGQASMTQSYGLISLAFGLIGGGGDPTAIYESLLRNSDSILFTPLAMSFDPASQGLMVTDTLLGRVNIYDTNSIDDGEKVFGVLNQTSAGVTGFLALILFGDQSQLLVSRDNVLVPYATFYDASTKTMLVSDVGASRIMGFENVKMPVPPATIRPLVITSPTSGATIGAETTVAGTGAGDTEINLTVDNRGPIKVKVGRDGKWSAQVSGLTPGQHTFKASYTKPEREFLLFNAYKTDGNFLLGIFGPEYGILGLIFQQRPTAASINVRTGETETVYDLSHDTPMFNGAMTLNRASTKAYSVANSFSNLVALLTQGSDDVTGNQSIVNFINKLSSDVSIIDTETQKVTGTIKIKPDKYGIADAQYVAPSPSASATPTDTTTPDPSVTPTDTPTPDPSASPTVTPLPSPTKANSAFGVLGFGMGPNDGKAYAYVVTFAPTPQGYKLQPYLQPIDLVHNTVDADPIPIGQGLSTGDEDQALMYIIATMFFGADIKTQPQSNNVWVRDGLGFSVLDSSTDTWLPSANPIPMGQIVPNDAPFFFGFSDFDFSKDGKHLYSTMIGSNSMINLNTQTRQTDSALPFMALSEDALFLPLNVTTSKTTGKLYASGIKASRVTLPSPEPSASSTPQPSELAGAFESAKFNYGIIEMNPVPTSFADEQEQADYLASIQNIYTDIDRADLSNAFGDSAEELNPIFLLLSILGTGQPSLSYDDQHLIMPYLNLQLQPFMGQQNLLLPVGTYEYRMLNLQSRTVDRTLQLSDPDMFLPYIMLFMSSFGLGNNRGGDYVGYLPSKSSSHSVIANVPGPVVTVTPERRDPSGSPIVETPVPFSPSPDSSTEPTGAPTGSGSANSSSGPGSVVIEQGSVADIISKANSFMGQVGNSIISGVKLIPAPAALGFPWLLLFLLLVLAARLVWQARREIQANRRLRELLTKRQQINEDETNFISLASHYLNTPITIIQGAIDVLYTTKKIPQSTAKKLQDMTKRIADKAKLISSNLSGGRADTAGTITPEDMPKSIVMRPAVIVAISLVVALVIISNWLFIGAGTLQLSAINIITQLVALGILVQFVVSSQRYRQHSAQDLALVQAQLKQIERLEKTRDEFLHETVGELNTDVETLRKYLSATGGLSNKQVKDGLARLQSLLARLDLLSTIERSAKKLQKSTFSLGGLAGDIKTTYAKGLKAKGIELELQGLEGFSVRQSREMLDLVLTALVDNAIKFAPEKTGRVVVSAQRKGEEVLIRVSDNGPGIAEAKRDSLFKPFSRTQSALKFDYEGQGLSLYLAKLILGKNDGEIALNERGLQGGATFEVRLHDKS